MVCIPVGACGAEQVEARGVPEEDAVAEAPDEVDVLGRGIHRREGDVLGAQDAARPSRIPLNGRGAGPTDGSIGTPIRSVDHRTPISPRNHYAFFPGHRTPNFCVNRWKIELAQVVKCCLAEPHHRTPIFAMECAKSTRSRAD